MVEAAANRPRFAVVLSALALTLVAVLGSASAAAASSVSPIFSYSAVPSTTQAGGHPDLEILTKFGNRLSDEKENRPDPCDCADAENIINNLPTGVIGDPHAAPYCTQVEFGNAKCPVDSQVGVAAFGLGLTPVFNMEPSGNQAGLLGLTVPLLHFPVFTILNARTGGDYGLTASVLGVGIHYFALSDLEIKLWGVPASPENDPMRFHFGQLVCYGFSEGDPARVDWTQLLGHSSCENPAEWGPMPSNSPEEAFLDNPTNCNEPLSASLRIDFYDGGTESRETEWPRTTGCDQLSFNPSLYAQPTTRQTDTASGLDVDLSVPQNFSPTSPSPSEIKTITVTLPPGMSINPNAADGKTSCSDAEAQFGTEAAADCPEFSKVGSVTISSSALPGPIPGYIYIGEPTSGDRYRIILTGDGFATHVKLLGLVRPDPQSGQLVIHFENLPQTPFTDFNLHFFGSERGLLATPTQCGTYPVSSTFTPWDSALSEQTSVQFFTLDSGPGGAPCPAAPRGFRPSFKAGVADTTAGAHTPFSVELSRPDGDQDLSGITVSPPPGLLATLAGVPYCSDAALSNAAASSYLGATELASPSCPSASQIGTSIVGAGAGTHPVYLSGHVYLAGPYKGAPLSLAVITPAVSGPYDLGNAVVRVAVHIDPATTRITAEADPLPQILGGVPLRLRSVQLSLNRQSFTLNPTNCDALATTGQLTGNEGTGASPSSRFQVANCASLPFAPKFSFRLSGSVKRRGNPGLEAVISNPSKTANLARAAVTLPATEILDNAHIENPCTRPEFAANACPASSEIGTAKAVTPLLATPLEGPVYLRTSGRSVPDVVAALRGPASQPIEIDLDGRVDSSHGGLRTTFDEIPDAQVSKFTLKLDGGKKGLLQSTEPVCKAPLHVVAKVTGQNGLTANQAPKLQAPCGTKAGKKHRRRAHHHGKARR